MQWAKQKSGFTIVELLIVVVVIAILAAITIVAYNGIQNRAKASAAQSAASQVAKKFALWQVENPNQAPSQETVASLTGSTPGTTFQYSPLANGAYCVTATTNSISYYFTQAGASPSAGACFGHNANGTTVITNLMPNPSIETNASGWSNSGNISVTIPTSGAAHGTKYLSGSRTGTAAIGLYSPLFDVTAGETYMASMSVKQLVGRQAFLRYRWYDASNNEIGSVANTANAGTGSWQRLSYSQVAPTGAVGARIDAVMNTTGAAVGDTLDIDAVMVTQGSTLYTYADGGSNGWLWQSTANSSISSGPPV